MRALFLASSALFLLSVYLPVSAAAITQYSSEIVTQYITGTISGSQTYDSAGFFGVHGANLDGKPFQAYFQYNRSNFKENGCGAPAGGTCDLRFSKVPASGQGSLANAATPGSVLVTIEVNGVGRNFATFKRSSLLFQNSAGNPGQFVITSDNLYDPSNPAPAIQFGLFYNKTTAFGAQLSPTNNPVDSKNIGSYLIDSFQIVAQPPHYVNEAFTFSVTCFSK